MKELRRRRGWSQKDLARESGIGQDTISNLELGRHEPRPSTLRKIANAFGIEVADLFGEEVPTLKAPEDPRIADKHLRDRLAPRIERLEGLGLTELSERRRELMERLSELKVYVPYTDEVRGVTGTRQEITDFEAYTEATDELFAVVLVLEKIAGRVEA